MELMLAVWLWTAPVYVPETETVGVAGDVSVDFSTSLNPGGGAGTDWSLRSLHGLPSIGEVLSLKSQGYFE